MAPFLKAGVFLSKKSYIGLNYHAFFFILNCACRGMSHNKDLWNANKFYSVLFNAVKVKFTLE